MGQVNVILIAITVVLLVLMGADHIMLLVWMFVPLVVSIINLKINQIGVFECKDV